MRVLNETGPRKFYATLLRFGPLTQLLCRCRHRFTVTVFDVAFGDGVPQGSAGVWKCSASRKLPVTSPVNRYNRLDSWVSCAARRAAFESSRRI